MHSGRCAPIRRTGPGSTKLAAAFFNTASIWKFNDSIIESNDSIDRTTRWLDTPDGRILTGMPMPLRVAPGSASDPEYQSDDGKRPEQTLVTPGFAREDLFHGCIAFIT